MNFFQSIFGSGEKQYKDVRAAEFMALLEASKDAVILDVRTPSEFARKKISKSINIDIYSSTFWDAIDQLDKDKTYFVYCRSGRRSGKACRLMGKRGFGKLYNLAGGIISM